MQTGRRLFNRGVKLEAVRLVRERGVCVVQASRDLHVGENVLRRWVTDCSADPAQAFPGQGQMKPKQLEIDRQRRQTTTEGRKRLYRHCILSGHQAPVEKVRCRGACDGLVRGFARKTGRWVPSSTA